MNNKRRSFAIGSTDVGRALGLARLASATPLSRCSSQVGRTWCRNMRRWPSSRWLHKWIQRCNVRDRANWNGNLNNFLHNALNSTRHRIGEKCLQLNRNKWYLKVVRLNSLVKYCAELMLVYSSFLLANWPRERIFAALFDSVEKWGNFCKNSRNSASWDLQIPKASRPEI